MTIRNPYPISDTSAVQCSTRTNRRHSALRRRSQSPPGGRPVLLMQMIAGVAVYNLEENYSYERYSAL